MLKFRILYSAIFHLIFQVLTSVDFRTVFDAPELKALGEGRLSISIRLKNQPEESTIKGLLAPKFSCDLFDCVLTPFKQNDNSQDSNGQQVQSSGAVLNNNNDDEDIEDEVGASLHAMRGLAWMTMHRTGSIKYQLRYETHVVLIHSGF